MKLKTCQICKKQKPISEYPVVGATAKGVLIRRSYCPDCEQVKDEQRRTFTRSLRFGPKRYDPDGKKTIFRCFDCSRSGWCYHQQQSPWPVTEIAENCPLPNPTERRKHDVTV